MTSLRLNLPLRGRNVLCATFFLAILPTLSASSDAGQPRSTAAPGSSSAFLHRGPASITAGSPLLMAAAVHPFPNVSCIAPTTMVAGSSAVVRIQDSVSTGVPLKEYFLASGGTLTINHVVTPSGRYTGFSRTARFSTAGLQPGKVYLFCHSRDPYDQTASSAATILITAQTTPVAVTKPPAPAPAPVPPATPAPAPAPAPPATPAPPVTPPPPPAPADIPSIACAGPTSVNQGDLAQIVASASDPGGRPLRIAFTTSSGSLAVNGSSAALSTNGLQPGTVNVTCTATNDSNGTASATAAISVNAVPGEQALTAFQFTDSLGVNVHLHFGNTPYVTNFPAFLASMKNLGVRHYRNGIDPYAQAFEYANAETLAHAGIKADWLIDVHDTAQNINAIYANAPDSIEAFEGPNEDNGDVGPTLTNFMQLLHDTVRGNPATANTVIYGPTVTTLGAVASIGDLSAYADFGNMHDYYNPLFPETPAYGGFFFNCGAYGTMSFNICLAQLDIPNRPVVSTETGYVSGTVSDTAIGRYIPRILFEHLHNNVPRTYLYEFVDEVNSPNYGLVKEDFTPKPVYSSLKNLMGLFQDNNFATPGKLALTLSGDTANVQHTTFQKSDGTWLVAIWLGVSSSDGLQTLNPPAQQVVLKTVTPTGNATLYTLDDNGNMNGSNGNTSSSATSIAVTDRITVVSLPRQ